MLPKEHIILGLIFSIVCFFIFPQIGSVGFLLLLLSSFLIDFDHYLYHGFIKKDWSLINAYVWFVEQKKKLFLLPRNQRGQTTHILFFFHGIEILLIVLISSFFVNFSIFIFIGFSFHLLFDLIEQTTYQDKLVKFSLLIDYLKYKRGLS